VISTIKGFGVSSEFGVPGELPPPPGIFFGRTKSIEKIVDFAEHFTSIALVGAGGIGKTSVALTVLHDNRIKQRFGDNRRFIRCDNLPASLPHFLRQLSKTVGANVENPEDLTSLRPFLSSKDMFIVLDSAESVLDPQGMNAKDIYGVVEELSRMSNICLCITSQISTVPPDCKWLYIPTLPMEAACDTFYRIYQHDERSDLIKNILKQLNFHPLSITLLATLAHHNRWDTERLAREWDECRTDMLRTDHNKSIVAAIELSLSSSMFRELGPDARDLLGVVAFFPQGVDENNIDWLFPAISRRKNIFDKFCALSLAYRSDGFITMLAPIRDYLSPKDPASAPLLCSTKELYFTRLSAHVEPGKPEFEEARWITSEDVNVEHLLDVFTTIDVTSGGVWGACRDFMTHLLWHKARLVVLGPKIEALADGHPFKPECVLTLSLLFQKVGNYVEPKRLLTHALGPSRGQGGDYQLARILEELSTAYSLMGLFEEGMQQAKEASETNGRLDGPAEQADSLVHLIRLFLSDNQLDAAEDTVPHAIDPPSEKGKQLLCICHHLLGIVYRSKDEIEKGIYHCKVALAIASPLDWFSLLAWIHFTLARLFFDQGRFDDAHAHIAHAELHATNGNEARLLANAVKLQAAAWDIQHRFKGVKSEALRAVDAFKKLGATKDVENVMERLRQIVHDFRDNVTPNEFDDDGEVPAAVLSVAFIDSSYSRGAAKE